MILLSIKLKCLINNYIFQSSTTTSNVICVHHSRPQIHNPPHPVMASIPGRHSIPSPFHPALQSILCGTRRIIRRPRDVSSRRSHENHRILLVRQRIPNPELRGYRRIRGCSHREEIYTTRRRVVFQGYRAPIKMHLVSGVDILFLRIKSPCREIQKRLVST